MTGFPFPRLLFPGATHSSTRQKPSKCSRNPARSVTRLSFLARSARGRGDSKCKSLGSGPLACSRRLPSLATRRPAHPVAAAARDGTSPAEGNGRSGHPSPPPTWARLSSESLGAPRRPRLRAGPGFLAPPHPQSQVVAGVPSGWARGNALPGDCVHAPLTQASRCRAAADHAWPREPIGRRLTHLCR